MGRRRKRKLSKKETKALLKQQSSLAIETTPVEPKSIFVERSVEIPQIITIRKLAEALNTPVAKIITALMQNGISATINESIDFDTASIIASDFGFQLIKKSESQKEFKDSSKKLNKKTLQPRPPVVVIMGHVDHGKTTLLDKIRQTNVASQESGSITQHIGAYQVKIPSTSLGAGKNKKEKGKISEKVVTFLDTPGHEAFSVMRAHGANITDIAVLVVAADDGVMPQTKEAISHAKAANIPIIVAINKVDKPQVDLERVKRQLADLGLVSEEWGGKTVMVPISAKTGKNIAELLDMILITSELLELKADPNGSFLGVVIESNMQIGVGPVAIVLVQNGTLRFKDTIITGTTFGKIKRLEDFNSQTIQEAIPSMPVKVIGLKKLPNFGDIVEVTQNSKQMIKELEEKSSNNYHLSSEKLLDQAQISGIKNLNIILKTDTQGSLEAIKSSIISLSNENTKVKIIHAGIGNINESDIHLAITAAALVVGFKVGTIISAKNLAETKKIKISTYDVIYQLLDDVQAAILGMFRPKNEEIILGKLEIIKIFNFSHGQQIVGGIVTEGNIKKHDHLNILRSDKKIGVGEVGSLQQEKNAVNNISSGSQCGLGVKTDIEIKSKDVLVAVKPTGK